MPSVAVKLYSVFFKFLLKHRLQNNSLHLPHEDASFGVTSRPGESVAPANASFTDGVATKDIHIDPFTSLSIRIFLPDSSLSPVVEPRSSNSETRRSSYGGGGGASRPMASQVNRRSSYGSADLESARKANLDSALANGDAFMSPRSDSSANSLYSDDGQRREFGVSQSRFESKKLNYNLDSSIPKRSGVDPVGKEKRQDGEGGLYRGYLPRDLISVSSRKLPIIMQFHGGGFVAGSKDSASNDVFCRRIAKLCDAIVIAVGYRLAPENRYPAAFDDGVKVLHWLAKQANLAECNKSLGNPRAELRKADAHRHIVDTFGASVVEPWLAAHGDPSRCILLGVSCGANIADFVTRKAVEAGKLLDPIKVVAQVLLYPFFIGSVPTHSEIKLANSYFYDKAMCILAWKLFLPEDEYSLDHPAANPLVPGREPPFRSMPPTLTVVAEHDWMRDRAIAYSEELRKVNIDAPVLEYKDAVHEFATLDMLVKSPQAQACAEDIAIWTKKYISIKGHEFSY